MVEFSASMGAESMKNRPENGKILSPSHFSQSAGVATTMNSRMMKSGFLSQVGDFCQILDTLQRLPGTMFAIKDLESRYVYMSSSLCDAIHVRSQKEVVGCTDFHLFPRFIAEAFRQNDLMVFETGKPLLNEIHLTCFLSGAPGWAFSSKFPLRDKSGRIIGLVLINELYQSVMGAQADLVRLLPAIDHVLKNYAERITVKELATVCGISASHFMRIFRERLKLTAHAFIEQVRMRHAMEALKGGEVSITQIALNCGFYDHSAFVKRFRKFTGVTPLRYRRQHQANYIGESPVILPVATGYSFHS
jgi:AraC-like DNA-binding protein